MGGLNIKAGGLSTPMTEKEFRKAHQKQMKYIGQFCKGLHLYEKNISATVS